MTYAYDRVGNRTQMVESRGDGSTYETVYDYDARDRLVRQRRVQTQEPSLVMGPDGQFQPNAPPRPPSRWAPRGLAAFAAVTLAGLLVPFGLLWPRVKTGTGSRRRRFGRRATAPTPCDHSTTNWLAACLSPFLWFGAASSFSGGKRARRQRCFVRTIALMLVPVLAVDPQMVWAVHAEALAYQALATAGPGQTSPNDVVVTYDYDGNGNLIGKTTNSGGTSTAETYVFDAESRLASFQPDNAGPTDIVAYTYDFDGIRTSKATGGSTTRYIADKNRDYAQVLEERNSASLETVRYVHGHDLISQTRHGPLGSQVTHYYHYDGQLSTRMLTDGNHPASPLFGEVTDSYTYDAFGNELASTGSTPNAYRYTGEQYDANLGFYYLRARYYDQNTGRFASRDPVAGSPFEPVTLHTYLYAGADPLNRIDPSGAFALYIQTMAVMAMRVINFAIRAWPTIKFGLAVWDACTIYRILHVGFTQGWGAVSASDWVQFGLATVGLVGVAPGSKLLAKSLLRLILKIPITGALRTFEGAKLYVGWYCKLIEETEAIAVGAGRRAKGTFSARDGVALIRYYREGDVLADARTLIHEFIHYADWVHNGKPTGQMYDVWKASADAVESAHNIYDRIADFILELVR